jgi:hypothetical protein
MKNITPKSVPPANPGKPLPKKPAHELRLSGVRASIWKNETDNGPRYNTTFERYWRDGEEWKSSTSLGRDDLLTLSFLAQEALRWIMAQRQDQPSTEPPNR